METSRDTSVGAAVSLAIIVIAALVLLYGLVSFLNGQKALDNERNDFFGTSSTTTVKTQTTTQTPAATSSPSTSGTVNIRVYNNRDDGDAETRTETHTTTTTETKDSSIKPTTTVSPSAPIINIPVTLPSIPGLNNII